MTPAIRLDLPARGPSPAGMNTARRRLLAWVLTAGLAPAVLAADEPAAPAPASAPAAETPAPPPAADTPAPAPPAPEPPMTDRLIEQSEQHYFRREYVEALRCLDLALEFAPADARAALETAWQRQADGDAAGALLAFHEATRRFPKLINIFTGLGFIRNETGDF